MSALAVCECGWTGRYANIPAAWRYVAAHRCSAYAPKPRRGPAPAHGTYARYVSKQYRCRCEPCRTAQRRYQKQRVYDRTHGRVRTVPAIGTVRRLQALMAIGWPGWQLAERLGVQQTNMPTHVRYPTVAIELAAKVAALYDELRLKDGPSTRTARHAGKNGFLSPDWWEEVDIDDPDALPIDPEPELSEGEEILDDVAIERAMAGERVEPFSRAERKEAFRRLLARKLTPAEAAARLHMNGSRANELAAELEEAS